MEPHQVYKVNKVETKDNHYVHQYLAIIIQEKSHQYNVPMNHDLVARMHLERIEQTFATIISPNINLSLKQV